MTDAIDLPADLLAELPEGWSVEMNVPIDTLVEHPRNPRRGNLAKIRESIREHGFVDVVIAQASTRHMMAGNHRTKAARLEGYERAPIVVWADVDDATAERFMLAHNRTSDEGDYDRTVLLDVLRDLDASADGLAGSLYESDEIDELRRITGELGDDVGGFLDDLNPADDETKPRGSGSETVTHLTFPFDQDQRDRVLHAVSIVKERDQVESSAVALATLCDEWLARQDG